MRIEINKSGAAEFNDVLEQQTEALVAALERRSSPTPILAALGRPLVVGECIFDDQEITKLTKFIPSNLAYQGSSGGQATHKADVTIRKRILGPIAEAFDADNYFPVINYGEKPVSFKDRALGLIHVDRAQPYQNGGLPVWSLQIKIPSADLGNITAYYGNQGVNPQAGQPGYYPEGNDTVAQNPAGHALYKYRGPLYPAELDDFLKQDDNGVALVPHVTDHHELSVPIIFNDGFVPHHDRAASIPEDSALLGVLPKKSIFAAIGYDYNDHGL